MAITLLFHQILTTLRYPPRSSLLTAKLSLSPIKEKTPPSIDEDTYTQFALCPCKQLGVELGIKQCASGKGRVERLNQTPQSRLPVELRLCGHNDP